MRFGYTFLAMSTDLISGAAHTFLTPNRSWLQVYSHDDCILPAIQNNSRQHIVSIFLGGNYHKIWPLWVLNKEIHPNPQLIVLQRGDALIYNSDKVHTWRDHFLGESHYQLYLYYDELSNHQ